MVRFNGKKAIAFFLYAVGVSGALMAQATSNGGSSNGDGSNGGGSVPSGRGGICDMRKLLVFGCRDATGAGGECTDLHGHAQPATRTFSA